MSTTIVVMSYSLTNATLLPWVTAHPAPLVLLWCPVAVQEDLRLKLMGTRGEWREGDETRG